MKHHGAGLHRLTGNEKLTSDLQKDFRTAELDKKDLAMLEYAAKLTLEPWNMVEADVIDLRNVGFSDESILGICQVTAYFAFVNRLADGLGVGLEGYWKQP